MFDWKIYPKALLDELRSKITEKKERTSNNIPKFVFLCGKGAEESNFKDTNRYLVQKYFDENSKNVYCLLAEELWLITHVNLLTFEYYLADISDLIVLFLESWGTATELGAFSIIEETASKMFVIIDKKYEHDKSFINYGPVRKVMEKSHPKNIMYMDINDICNNDIMKQRIKEFINKKKTHIIARNPKRININAYLIELLDVLEVLGPVKEDELIYLYKYIKSFDQIEFALKSFKQSYALDCLKKCKLIKVNNYGYIYVNRVTNPKNILLFELNKTEYSNLRSKFLNFKAKYLDKEVFSMKGLA